MVDVYGEPGEDYPVTMENHSDRMSRISAQDVLEKVQVWRSNYGG